MVSDSLGILLHLLCDFLTGKGYATEGLVLCSSLKR